MKERSVDFVDDFEQAFLTLVIYLIQATGGYPFKATLEDMNNFYDQFMKNKSIGAVTADALNRIEQLKKQQNLATPLSNN